MIHPDDIVPGDLMDASHRESFLRWLRNQGFRAAYKVELARGWAYEVGTELTRSELETIHNSGIDIP